MAAKKAKKPARSIRYLLSADWKLQRISLQRISEGIKKGQPSPKAVRAKRSARAKEPAGFQWAISPRAIVVSAIVFLAAVALISARQSSPSGSHGKVERAQDGIEAPPVSDHPEVIPPQTVPKSVKDVALTPPKPPARTTVAVSNPPAPKVIVKDLPESSVKPPPPPPTVDPAPRPTTAPALTIVEGDAEPAVTIMGCLEDRDGAFRLKDTAGMDAPKSRSWKSGFLRKRPAAIRVVDRTGRLRLGEHVGQRVTVTGTLTDRTMEPRSLRRVGASCD